MLTKSEIVALLGIENIENLKDSEIEIIDEFINMMVELIYDRLKKENKI